MQDRPDPVELVRTVAATLRDKLMPRLSGSAAFEARVAINALELVARQLDSQAASEGAELKRLEALLGEAGPLGALNARLCQRIADGSLTIDDPKLHAHLWATTLEKLAVDQPTYGAYLDEVDRA